jgi:hypothetical protein
MLQSSTVTKLRLTPSIAEKRIHTIAKITSRVALTAHAKERMAEREISVRELYEILRSGQIEESPTETEGGEWKCKVTLKLTGRRVAGAVVALPRKDKIIVITVEWEDGK